MIARQTILDKLELIGRIFLALLFLYAGVPKILNPAKFAEDIDNYRMLPYALVPIMAAVLPYLEVIAAGSLLTKRFRNGAALAMLAMSLMFEIAIGTAVFRGLDISCGCFVGPGEINTIGITRLLTESLLLGLTIFVYYYNISDKKRPPNFQTASKTRQIFPLLFVLIFFMFN
ncbi:DoxX family membrane protein [candidate division KSB1 bacterium]|nr:DoxX family membrane protein [candidate division KSB1 bacterium]